MKETIGRYRSEPPTNVRCMRYLHGQVFRWMGRLFRWRPFSNTKDLYRTATTGCAHSRSCCANGTRLGDPGVGAIGRELPPCRLLWNSPERVASHSRKTFSSNRSTKGSPKAPA